MGKSYKKFRKKVENAFRLHVTQLRVNLVVVSLHGVVKSEYLGLSKSREIEAHYGPLFTCAKSRKKRGKKVDPKSQCMLQFIIRDDTFGCVEKVITKSYAKN